ncbi:PGF-pre-PGF domain-containing protein [Salinigranum marinum]|uniref:PGF-pre-PGF domain-containing protein n=1 Tax=Salinigranum marinum TaxID=1515595 RepID=UPI002989F56B|nr:PGF-pre-PGF domain-containing protein [Salinigranum marinum]
MKRIGSVHLGLRHAVVGIVLAIALTTGLIGIATAAGSIDVSLVPETRSLDVGDATTVDVMVESASGGVGSYDLQVVVGDSAVATVTAATAAGGPSYENTAVFDGGKRADIVATGADTADTGTVTVASVTVEATGSGSTPLSLRVTDVSDEDGVSYTVSDTPGATVSVSGTPTPTTTATAEPTDDSSDGDAADDGGDGPAESFDYSVIVDDGVTRLELSDAAANRRYDIDLGNSISAGESTVTAAEFFFDRSVTAATVRFDASETPPESVTGLDTAIVYVAVEADGVAAEDINEVEVGFTVSQSTLDNRGLAPDEIRLYRYDGGAWIPHETTHDGETEFTAEDVPTFGVYAIGPSGSTAVTATSSATATPPTDSSTASPIASTTPTETETTPATAAETPLSTRTPAAGTRTTSTTFPGFTPIAGLVALATAAVVAARTSRR